MWLGEDKKDGQQHQQRHDPVSNFWSIK